MRRNRKLVLLVFMGLVFMGGLLWTRFQRENADKNANTAPIKQRLQLQDHQASKEQASRLMSGDRIKSIDPPGRYASCNATGSGFVQTYYKWNDMASHGWESLPLKKFKNCSSVPSGLTREEATEAVIYTRVPKTGSRSMLDLIRSAADRNKFYMIYSIVYNHSSVAQNRFVRAVGRIRPPFLLARQLFFIDFTGFKMAQPTYISLVRDPIDRLVSSFNFNRFGDGTRNKWYKMFKGDKNMTLDACILQTNTECSAEAASVTIRYFCGHDKRCKLPSDWSLRRAKRNVLRHYSVVGVMEDYEGTLKVLEKRLPDFFTGVSREYAQSKGKIITASKKKYTPSPKAKEVLRQRLHLEYKFYEFIKRQLNDLMVKLNMTITGKH